MEVWISTTELAQKSGLSSRTIQRYCDAGEIPHRRFPGKILILSTDAERWLSQFEQKTDDTRDTDDNSTVLIQKVSCKT